MTRYAIEIRPENLPLITRLNYGVTPLVESKTTYFVFEPDNNSDFPETIMTEEELLRQEAFENANRMSIYRLK